MASSRELTLTRGPTGRDDIHLRYNGRNLHIAIGPVTAAGQLGCDIEAAELPDVLRMLILDTGPVPSMGALIAYTKCAICGHDSRHDRPCTHVDPTRKVEVMQDVTVKLTPDSPALRLRTDLPLFREVSPPVTVPADHAAAVDPRGAYGNLLCPATPEAVQPRDVLRHTTRIEVDFDARELVSDIVEEACVAFAQDQYTGTGIPGAEAADRLYELLKKLGVELAPWPKEE